MGRISVACTLVWALCILSLLPDCRVSGQQSHPPSPQEVKELNEKYQAERQNVLQEGAAKRFPLLLAKAEEWAGRGEKALADGRLLQARECFVKARWQLPYPSPEAPAQEHVAWTSASLRPRLRHDKGINALAYSPDGRFLATAGNDHMVKIWDLGNGREVLSYPGHTDHVRTLAFSPDGKMIASSQGGPPIKGDGPPIRLWDVATGKDIRTFPGKGFVASSLVFSSDGKFLVSGHLAVQVEGPKHVLSVFETATGKVHRLIDDFRTPVTSVALNDKGTILAVATGFLGGPGEVRLWEFARLIDPANDAAYWALSFPTGPIQQVLIGPDNRTLVCHGINDIRIFDLPLPDNKNRIGAPTQVLKHPGFAHHLCVAQSRDGKTLYAGCMDGSIRMYSTLTGELIGNLSGHNGVGVHTLALSPTGGARGGPQLASLSADHTIRIWDLDVAEDARDFPGHEGSVWKVSFSPDGRRIVSASADRSVKVWNVADGTILSSITGHQAPVMSALFSPDGKIIASAGGDRVVKLWHGTSGRHLRDLEGHTGTITALDMNGVWLDENAEKKAAPRLVLASGGADRTVRIWDAQAGKELSIINNGAVVVAVAFSPDGKQLAVGSVDKTIKLFDVAEIARGGETVEQARWTAHNVALSSLAYSPDGQYLASGGADSLVYVWPLTTPGKASITLSGHKGTVSAVAFHSDSRHLATCGSDKEIKLWKIVPPLTAGQSGSGTEVQRYRGHRDWVMSVAFSKDGENLVSCGLDRLIKVWAVALGENSLVTAEPPQGAVQSVAASPDGKYIASGFADRTIRIWDRAKGTELFILTGHTGAIASLAFTPDSKFLFSSCVVPLLPYPPPGAKFPANGGADRSTKRWNVALGQEAPLKFQPPSGIPMSTPQQLFITPDGKKLVLWTQYAGGHTDAVGFDPDDGRYLFRHGDVYRPTQSVAFSADGRFMSTCGSDCSIRVFDLNNGIPVYQHLWHIFEKERAGASALSPDGSQIICANAKGAVRIGKIDGKEVLHTFQAHDTAIHRCVVSPDGKRLATAAQDNLVKLWDLDSRTELRRWSMGAGAGNLVASLAFTPDSKQLVSGHGNGKLYVLDLP